jgi:hypothetical protein
MYIDQQNIKSKIKTIGAVTHRYSLLTVLCCVKPINHSSQTLGAGDGIRSDARKYFRYNLLYRRNSFAVHFTKYYFRLGQLSRRGGQTVHRTVCLSARSNPVKAFANQKPPDKMSDGFIGAKDGICSADLLIFFVLTYYIGEILLPYISLNIIFVWVSFHAGAGKQYTVLFAYPPVQIPSKLSQTKTARQNVRRFMLERETDLLR